MSRWQSKVLSTPNTFDPLLPAATPNTNTDHKVYISSSVVDFKRYHLLKPKKITCFNSMFTQATDIFHENILEGTLIFIWRARPRHPSISKIQ